jgi:hypothetical protein
MMSSINIRTKITHDPFFKLWLYHLPPSYSRHSSGTRPPTAYGSSSAPIAFAASPLDPPPPSSFYSWIWSPSPPPLDNPTPLTRGATATANPAAPHFGVPTRITKNFEVLSQEVMHRCCFYIMRANMHMKLLPLF